VVEERNRQSMADENLRVKLKAIDILGAREANAAVAPMSSIRSSTKYARSTRSWRMQSAKPGSRQYWTQIDKEKTCVYLKF
jgi:hypothetical protein